MIKVTSKESKLIETFFNALKSESVKEYARKILEYLENARFGKETVVNNGWVRARDIYNALVETGEIGHATQLFRLLDSLHDSGIIEKCIDSHHVGKGKPPAYYRIPQYYGSITWKSRWDLINEIKQRDRFVWYLLVRMAAINELNGTAEPDLKSIAQTMQDIEKRTSYITEICVKRNNLIIERKRWDLLDEESINEIFLHGYQLS